MLLVLNTLPRTAVSDQDTVNLTYSEKPLT